MVTDNIPNANTKSRELPQSKQLPLVWRILTAMVMAGFGVFALSYMVSSVSEIQGDDSYSSGVLTIAGLLPLIYGVVVIPLIFRVIDGYSENTEEEQSVEDYWVQYGKGLKLAYASKFGGENNGFNQEIDQRVGVMMNNGRGFTRALAKDWLKRMHKFTEAK